MLTEEYLKENYIGAYFIDNERKNIEILTTSPDKKSVQPTIIPYIEDHNTFKELMKVITIDDLHENTYNKIKKEKQIFENQVMSIAKRDGLIFDEKKLDTKFYPSLVKAIFNDDKNEDHLFALKLALFEVDKIRDSKNSELKKQLRQSKTKLGVIKIAIEFMSD